MPQVHHILALMLLPVGGSLLKMSDPNLLSVYEDRENSLHTPIRKFSSLVRGSFKKLQLKYVSRGSLRNTVHEISHVKTEGGLSKL